MLRINNFFVNIVMWNLQETSKRIAHHIVPGTVTKFKQFKKEQKH